MAKYKYNKQYQYNKEWYKKFDGFYVYIIKDLDNNIMYVGETTNYYKRLGDHTSKCVKTTKDFIKQGNYIIEYLDMSNDIKTEEELLYLENVLIELYEPPLNNQKNIIRNVVNLRMFELCAKLHSFSANWITYCQCRNGEKDKKNMFV